MASTTSLTLTGLSHGLGQSVGWGRPEGEAGKAEGLNGAVPIFAL